MYGFFGLFTLVLVSCEGGTTFTKEIVNQSTATIEVEVFLLSREGESYVINPGDSAQVYWDDYLGRFVDETYTCTNELDSIVLSTSDGRELVKNILDGSNWERNSQGGRNSKEDCVFYITDDDLE